MNMCMLVCRRGHKYLVMDAVSRGLDTATPEQNDGFQKLILRDVNRTYEFYLLLLTQKKHTDATFCTPLFAI